MDDPRDIMEARYARLRREDRTICGEPWLENWLSLVPARVPPRALDLGCGIGRNSRLLLDSGYDVTAADFSRNALTFCSEIAPEARRHCVDLRDGLPYPPGSFELIVADLSLHYFDWETTVSRVSEIASCLVAGGLFVARYNSEDNVNYGATTAELVGADPHLRMVRGYPKRFFTSECLSRLYGFPWTVVSLEAKTTDRFGSPKALWEIVATRP